MIPCSPVLPPYPHAYWAWAPADQQCVLSAIHSTPNPCSLCSLLFSVLCSAQLCSKSVPVEAERQRRIIRQHNSEQNSLQITILFMILDNTIAAQPYILYNCKTLVQLASPQANLRQHSFATSIISLCSKLFPKNYFSKINA